MRHSLLNERKCQNQLHLHDQKRGQVNGTLRTPPASKTISELGTTEIKERVDPRIQTTAGNGGYKEKNDRIPTRGQAETGYVSSAISKSSQSTKRVLIVKRPRRPQLPTAIGLEKQRQIGVVRRATR